MESKQVDEDEFACIPNMPLIPSSSLILDISKLSAQACAKLRIKDKTGVDRQDPVPSPTLSQLPMDDPDNDERLPVTLPNTLSPKSTQVLACPTGIPTSDMPVVSTGPQPQITGVSDIDKELRFELSVLNTPVVQQHAGTAASPTMGMSMHTMSQDDVGIDPSLLSKGLHGMEDHDACSDSEIAMRSPEDSIEDIDMQRPSSVIPEGSEADVQGPSSLDPQVAESPVVPMEDIAMQKQTPVNPEEDDAQSPESRGGVEMQDAGDQPNSGKCQR